MTEGQIQLLQLIGQAIFYLLVGVGTARFARSQNRNTSKIDTLNTKVERVETKTSEDVQSVKDGVKTSLDDHASKLTELFGQFRSDNQALVQMVLANKDATIEALKRDGENRDRDVREFKALVGTQAGELEKLKTGMATLRREQVEAEQRHKAELERLSTELKTKETDLVERDEEIRALKAKVQQFEALEERVKVLEDVVRAMNEEHTRLHEMLRRVEQERDDARNQLKAALTDKDRLIAERDELKLQIAKLSTSTDQLDTQDLAGLVEKPPTTVEMPKLNGDTPDAT